MCDVSVLFFFSSRRRHTRCGRDWSSDVCSSDLPGLGGPGTTAPRNPRTVDPSPWAAAPGSPGRGATAPGDATEVGDPFGGGGGFGVEAAGDAAGAEGEAAGLDGLAHG